MMSSYCEKITVPAGWGAGLMKNNSSGVVKRMQGFAWDTTSIKVLETYDCNECKHRLSCLIDPECNRIFESK